MILQTINTRRRLPYNIEKLSQRMLSPLCGLTQEIGIITRSRNDPRLATAGVNLTGVHLLLGRPDPGRGAYHIGGVGVYYHEAIIKALGESVERYSQLMSEFIIKNKIKRIFASYEEIKNTHNVVKKEFLDIYSSAQLAQTDFIFTGFDPHKPLTWLEFESVISKNKVWVPAQCVFIGYSYQQDEPRLMPAVTTGTATHITYPKAIRSALLEIIQIDSAMGHWYTNYPAYEIQFDERTKPFEQLMEHYSESWHKKPLFYWLPNADLGCFTIACVFVNEKGHIPRVAVGLGADTSLLQAMYKAYLEAYGVVGLSRMILFKEKYNDSEDVSVNSKKIFDLDSNVGLYAKGELYSRFEERFLKSSCIKASDLPADMPGSPTEHVRKIIEIFAQAKHELIHMDISSLEARELGFVVSRMWSPNLLSLCLPSAVSFNHPRFKSYGGVSHDDPHPYP